MMGKTHLVAGIATAITLTQPKNTTDLIIATVGGAAGGILADIDVKIEDTGNALNMDGVYTDFNAIVLITGLLLYDFFTSKLIVQSILDNWTVAAIGLVSLIGLIIFGIRSKHRTFTHSLLAMLLFSIAIALIHIPIGVCALFAYASHLLLDLFNKSPIQLLYPFGKKGICFKLCYASRWGNEGVFAIGILLIAVYVLLIIQ